MGANCNMHGAKLSNWTKLVLEKISGSEEGTCCMEFM